VNQELRTMITQDKQPELTAMLASQVCQGKNIKQKDLLDVIEDRFEDAKRRFNPYDPSQPRTTPVQVGVDGVQIGQLHLDRLVSLNMFGKSLCFQCVHIVASLADCNTHKGILFRELLTSPPTKC
jgi:hypothetical protein